MVNLGIWDEYGIIKTLNMEGGLVQVGLWDGDVVYSSMAPYRWCINSRKRLQRDFKIQVVQ